MPIHQTAAEHHARLLQLTLLLLLKHPQLFLRQWCHQMCLAAVLLESPAVLPVEHPTAPPASSAQPQVLLPAASAMSETSTTT